MFRRLSQQVLVAGQIGPEAVAEAAASGITAIVNNRPDGEEPGQPTGSEIEAAAKAAGLAYHHIPIWGSVTPEAVARMAAVLDEEGAVLAFCRSGTRSTWVWAMAQASRGGGGEALIAQAAAAGFDLEPLRPYLG